MNRKRALRQLYAQHQTERAFGWYDGSESWRSQLREIYPVAHVSAHHRGEFTEEHYGALKYRLGSFHHER